MIPPQSIISRSVDMERFTRLRSVFPITAILGPRQCGKTTFARQFNADHYFDLEPHLRESYLMRYAALSAYLMIHSVFTVLITVPNSIYSGNTMVKIGALHARWQMLHHLQNR